MASFRRGALIIATLSMWAGGMGLNAIAADEATAAKPIAKLDPCSLISAAEAQSILGVPLVTLQSGDDGLFRHCVYSSQDKRNYLKLEAISSRKALFERWMQLKGHGLPSRGLGNDAYTNSGVLLVWKNGVQLNISVGDESGHSNVDRLKDAEERAAQIALSRL